MVRGVQGERSVTENRDLESGFNGSIPQSSSDVTMAMREGLLSLDTNTLLNFYRYSAQAREALLEVLAAASDRVWVSHQAAREFWRNRMNVIDDRKSAAKVVTEALEKNLRAMQAAIRTWAEQTAVPEDVEEEITEQLAGATADLRESIERESAETGTITYDAATDSVVRRLRPLLQGRVGPPLPVEEFHEAVETYTQRVEQQIPPGFADAGKVGQPRAELATTWSGASR